MTDQPNPTAKPKRTTKPKTPKAKTSKTSKTKVTATPAIPTEAAKAPKGKLGGVAAMLRTPNGATIPELMEATGWQAHSVRGALAGALKKKFQYEVLSIKPEGEERRYRIVDEADAL